MAINVEDVEKVAKLAKLEFDSEEKKLIARQLDQIVAYVEKLNELDTSQVEPTSHVLDLKNVFRKDEVIDWITCDEALMNAPARNRNYFSVPKVIG
jgi:aspartyl-tRNA(Asn)/glutamyl-tRNA(Gln) amidotransferase subunit C